jgi:acetylornithine deacetylase/succinyl-diaminopimelate desuccinylase-like protein
MEMDVRSYDPAIGRFTGIDPVTHYDFSTYTAFDNNPIFWSDPSGADAECGGNCDENGQAYIVNGKYRTRAERNAANEGVDNNLIDIVAAADLVGKAMLFAEGKDLSKLTEKEKQKYFETDELTTIGILLFEFATGTGKESRTFIYGKHAFATSFLSGRVLQEAAEKFVTQLVNQGYNFNTLNDTEEFKVSLEFSPTKNPSSWLESLGKHLNSNWSQLFVGGARANVSIKDQNMMIQVDNETSRRSYFLHLPVQNYKRVSGKKNKLLSTIKQHINGSFPIHYQEK